MPPEPMVGMNLVMDFLMADSGVAVSDHVQGETADPSLEFYTASSKVMVMHVQQLCAFVSTKLTLNQLFMLIFNFL